MVDAIQFAGGLALLALIFFDFVQTSIGTAGTGPVSKRIARLIWYAARAIVPRIRRVTDASGLKVERAVGPAVLCGIAAVWVAISWTAYTLFFLVEGAASLRDGAEPTVSQTMALAGASLSTLGASIAKPGGGWWDVLSAVAAINGWVMLTLSVSFMMTVWQTTGQARSMALRVAAVHERSGAMSEDEVAEALSDLGPGFTDLVVAIRGVPVIAYFATEHERMNFPVSIMHLCDLVERIGPMHPSRGYAQLRLAMRELASLLGDIRSEADEFDTLRRWAEAHRIMR